MFQFKASQVPNAITASVGVNISNIVGLRDNDSVAAMFTMKKSDSRLLLVTSQGFGKSVTLAKFGKIPNRGIVAIKLRNGDFVEHASLARNDSTVFVATR